MQNAPQPIFPTFPSPNHLTAPNTPHPDRLFVRIAAWCAFATALTTFLLWLLPKLYDAPQTFEAGLALARNTPYLARQWVNLLHIPLALMAYTAFAYTQFRSQPLKAAFGMGWFVVWGTVEMMGVATLLFAVNGTWRSAYQTAEPARQAVLRGYIEGFYPVWDSLFFVLLVAFLLGTLFFGWASWRERGLGRALSGLFWLAVPLTALILLAGYADAAWAGVAAGYTYPFLQPVSRFTLGLYLWRHSSPNRS